MARKQGDQRTSCNGKQRHATREDAQRHLQSLWLCFGYKGRVYRCRYCGAYHVGHLPRSRRYVR